MKQRAEVMSAAQAKVKTTFDELLDVQGKLEQLGLVLYQREQELAEKGVNLMVSQGIVADQLRQIEILEQQIKQGQELLSVAHTDSEFMLSHLLHVQEELEHYFVLSCDQSRLIMKQKEQQKRAVKLLARCLSVNQDGLSLPRHLLLGITHEIESTALEAIDV
jgi:flagellar biosynthesis chaperone FliJ